MADLEKINIGKESVTQKISEPGALSETREGVSKQVEVVASVIEKASETSSENGTKAITPQTQTQTTPIQDTGTSGTIPTQQIPTTDTEFRQVLKIAIKLRIKTLLIEVKKMEQTKNFSAHKFTNLVKELRKLQIQLKSLLHMTLDKLKELYLVLFPTSIK